MFIGVGAFGHACSGRPACLPGAALPQDWDPRPDVDERHRSAVAGLALPDPDDLILFRQA